MFSQNTPQAETTAAEPVDFADVELAPLNKDNLRRLMHEDVLAYRPELRSPAAGSSLPEATSHTGGREATRDGSGKHTGNSRNSPPAPSNGTVGSGGSNGASAPGESSHVSSRVANGGGGGTTAGASSGGHRERSSRTDRDRERGVSGRSTGGSGRVSENGQAGSSSRHDGRDSGMGGGGSSRSHAATRVRSGGAVARQPFPTEG